MGEPGLGRRVAQSIAWRVPVSSRGGPGAVGDDLGLDPSSCPGRGCVGAATSPRPHPGGFPPLGVWLEGPGS